jgi:hypothetical protein
VVKGGAVGVKLATTGLPLDAEARGILFAGLFALFRVAIGTGDVCI